MTSGSLDGCCSSHRTAPASKSTLNEWPAGFVMISILPQSLDLRSQLLHEYWAGWSQDIQGGSKMNRRFAWIWGLVTAGIATVVGLIAYHAGQTSQVVTTTTSDGRFVYPG